MLTTSSDPAGYRIIILLKMRKNRFKNRLKYAGIDLIKKVKYLDIKILKTKERN